MSWLDANDGFRCALPHPTSIVFCAKTYSVRRRDGVPPRPCRLFAAAPRKGAAMIVVAIDIGGTFTDLVGFDAKAGRFVEAKSLTTPRELTQGVLDCIRKSGLDAGAVDELIHGSTIAINTLIERTGAKTALVVTSGTRDVYIIGRGNRPESYNLFFHRHKPCCHVISPARSRSGSPAPARFSARSTRRASPRPAASSPPKVSKRLPCASCTPTSIRATSASS